MRRWSRPYPKAATPRLAPWPAASSAIAGRPAHGCSVVEAQGDWADLSGSNGPSLLVGGGGSNRSKIDAIGLFTGQVGYAWNNVLLYVKGGVMGVNDKYEGFITATGFVFDHASETRWNGAVGAGLDFGVTSNIVLGVDYVHGFMGSRDNSFTFNGGGILAHRSHSSGRRHRHRARQLQIRRPRHREILTAHRAH